MRSTINVQNYRRIIKFQCTTYQKKWRSIREEKEFTNKDPKSVIESEKNTEENKPEKVCIKDKISDKEIISYKNKSKGEIKQPSITIQISEEHNMSRIYMNRRKLISEEYINCNSEIKFTE